MAARTTSSTSRYGRDRADRPVRAKHQPFRAEALERRVDVAAAGRRRPALPVRLGDQTRQLGTDVRKRRQPIEIAPPAVESAAADIRLAQMIEDETLTSGSARREVDGRRQLPRVNRMSYASPWRSKRGRRRDETLVVDQEVVRLRPGRCGGRRRASDAATRFELRVEIADRRSTQPTTPAMNGCASASASSQRVSSRRLPRPERRRRRRPQRRAHLAQRVVRQEVALQRGHRRRRSSRTRRRCTARSARANRAHRSSIRAHGRKLRSS